MEWDDGKNWDSQSPSANSVLTLPAPAVKETLLHFPPRGIWQHVAYIFSPIFQHTPHQAWVQHLKSDPLTANQRCLWGSNYICMNVCTLASKLRANFFCEKKDEETLTLQLIKELRFFRFRIQCSLQLKRWWKGLHLQSYASVYASCVPDYTECDASTMLCAVLFIFCECGNTNRIRTVNMGDGSTSHWGNGERQGKNVLEHLCWTPFHCVTLSVWCAPWESHISLLTSRLSPGVHRMTPRAQWEFCLKCCFRLS